MAKSKFAQYLEGRGLNQTQFIKLIEDKTNKKFSKATISNYVNAKHCNILMENAMVLAIALDITLDELNSILNY